MSKTVVNVSDLICQTESMVQFDKDIVSEDFTNSKEINTYFGIVNLKIKKMDPIIQKRHFVFTVDCSGSMSDLCNDGRTKMDHSNHTLINMITYFAEHPELSVSVSVFAFDSDIYKIIENEEVIQENLDKLIHCVRKIRPKDMTNIEKALLNSKEYIASYIENNTETNICHIFMTDGDATQGNTMPNELKEFVAPLVSNIFIGFGLEHNAYLLKELAATESKNNYYFVDALEKSGFVYGEILHSVIYRLLENTTITVTNGLVYDWKKNSWVDTIEIGDLVSESNKIFHVLSNNPSDFTLVVSTIDCTTKDTFDLHIQNSDGFIDLSNYKYRQRTQQLLFDVNLHNFDVIKHNVSYSGDKYDELHKTLQSNGKLLKEKMKKLLKEMQQLSQSLEKDEEKAFIKLLCDDIFICLQTFESKHSAMYSCARQASQGAQRSYSATYTPKFDNNTPFQGRVNMPQFKRSYAVNMHSQDLDYDVVNDNDDDDDDNAFVLPTFPKFSYNDNCDNDNCDNDNEDDYQNNYKVSEQIDNPNSTLSILSLMRSCSAGMNDNKLFR
uniref:VWFA domain-containing protein n=1 Tax=viral metagenome TaxID=1070528 RepID=A0A6C0JHY2_9ZZZZ